MRNKNNSNISNQKLLLPENKTGKDIIAKTSAQINKVKTGTANFHLKRNLPEDECPAITSVDSGKRGNQNEEPDLRISK